MASGQCRQDSVLVIDKSLAAKLAGGEVVRCVSREQQQRNGLIALPHNVDDGLPRPRPRDSLNVDFRLQVRKGRQHSFKQSAMSAVKSLTRIRRVLKVRFEQEQAVANHGKGLSYC